MTMNVCYVVSSMKVVRIEADHFFKSCEDNGWTCIESSNPWRQSVYVICMGGCLERGLKKLATDSLVKWKEKLLVK